MIDCRTCKNISERSGGCMSVVKCISGSGYRDTAAVQLFEGPAPTYDTRLRGVARAVVDDALSGGNVYIVSVSAISELRRALGE